MQSKYSRRWISFTQEPAATFCKCKSACTTKRKGNSSRGCPCKGRNVLCTDECKCGTSNKPCRNRVCMHIKLNTFTSFVIELWKSVWNNLCIPFLQDSNEQSSSAYESRIRRIWPRLEGSGFRLWSGATDVPTEDQQQIKETNDVKVFFYSLVRCCVFFSYLYPNYDAHTNGHLPCKCCKCLWYLALFYFLISPETKMSEKYFYRLRLCQ